MSKDSETDSFQPPPYGAMPPDGHQLGQRADQQAINAAVNVLGGKVSEDDVKAIVDAYIGVLKMMYIFMNRKVSEL